MRRFIAFIVLAISLLGITLFNVQSTTDKINWSQEFDRGTEVVYRIENRERKTKRRFIVFLCKANTLQSTADFRFIR